MCRPADRARSGARVLCVRPAGGDRVPETSVVVSFQQVLKATGSPDCPYWNIRIMTESNISLDTSSREVVPESPALETGRPRRGRASAA